MSQTVVALPRLIELRSQFNNTLLRYVKEEGEVKGFVQFSGDHVGRAEAKFEVHSSTTGNGLVHIRSCYNNKYLQVGDDTNNWIVAKAEKPEEDQSKRSCTLLRPTSVDGNPKNIRLTNVHLENYLRLQTIFEPYFGSVSASFSDPDASSRDVFNVIDWQSLVFLPRYVALKGIDNNRFIRALQFENQNYLQFSATNVEDDPILVGNEIMQTSNGNISIRNMFWDKYWRLSPNPPNWIWADSTVFISKETLFEPVKYSDDTIAIRNVANSLFCKRLIMVGRQNFLSASTPTIDPFSILKVSEFIISRKIENLEFRLMDARIYDESIVVMVSSSLTNQGSTTQEQTHDLSFTDMKSSTWNRNLSVKASIATSFRAGMPFIEEGQVKVGSEIAGEFMWGETTEEERSNISISFEVKVPPNTKMAARIIATRGTCDVPFSYTQREVLQTGETVITDMVDGVYTGVNNYSFYAETKQESLLKDPNMETAGFKKVAKVSLSGVMTPI